MFDEFFVYVDCLASNRITDKLFRGCGSKVFFTIYFHWDYLSQEFEVNEYCSACICFWSCCVISAGENIMMQSYLVLIYFAPW